MKPVLMALIFIVSLGQCPLTYAENGKITQAELVHRTQELFDAVAPGDRAPWSRYLADDVLFFDEKGRNMDKAAVLADVEPMPPGYTGSIKITNPNTRFAQNIAILSYDSEETETIFGQELHARYHTTDTWVYRDSQWRIMGSQTLRYYDDPAVGKVAVSLLQDYVGTYELSPGNTIVVTQKAEKLYAQRGPSAAVELLPEVPDLFFRAGVEGRRLFHRDPAGRVNLLIDRRNNEDIIYKKIQ